MSEHYTLAQHAIQDGPWTLFTNQAQTANGSPVDLSSLSDDQLKALYYGQTHVPPLPQGYTLDQPAHTLAQRLFTVDMEMLGIAASIGFMVLLLWLVKYRFQAIRTTNGGPRSSAQN